jgi:hypothetical protein
MKRFGLQLVIAGTLLLGACGGSGRYYYASTPPPPVRVETRGFAPGPGYAWVDGYWGYNRGGYAWTPGYYARPPRAGAVWVAPRWQSRGGRYYMSRGHWR